MFDMGGCTKYFQLDPTIGSRHIVFWMMGRGMTCYYHEGRSGSKAFWFAIDQLGSLWTSMFLLRLCILWLLPSWKGFRKQLKIFKCLEGESYEGRQNELDILSLGQRRLI